MRKGRLALLAAALTLSACWGACGGGGGGGAAGPSGGAAGQAAVGPDYAALATDMDARRRAYLAQAASGAASAGEGLYTQIARLETGMGPLSRQAFERALDKMDAREDTADFAANALLRLIHLHGTDPLIPSDLRQRSDRTLLGFKYWIDEPGTDEMVFWSENHQALFATAEYLAGHLFPQQVFPNAGLTGTEHAVKARARIVRWLDARMRFGFSEWFSPVYYEEDLAALLNLADFAPEQEIRDRAAIVLDLLIFDLARLTNRGSFGVTSGRAYEEMKWSGWGQSVGDLIEILFGTRGRFRSRGSPSATGFATSRGYKVPHVLIGIGRDAPERLVDRSRNGIGFGDAAAAGLGFSSFEDGIFWWGMGAYVAPETIILSRRMVSAWDLWHYSYFQPLTALRSVPESMLPGLSSFLSPLSEGSVLSTANAYTYRTPDAMLSSVQRYRRGQVGYQQHAWQATLDMDAVVFTTSPGTFGRDGPGEWTGSGSLPRVLQVDNVVVALYNPSIAQKALFPSLTHAFFPSAAFDEVTTQGAWTFARKGDGYLALFSALPTYWQQSGPFARRELVAPGERNVWICQVGRRAVDGPFADFVSRVGAAQVAVTGAGNAPQTDPLGTRYDAPGLGPIEVAWDGDPMVGGLPWSDGGFPRYDNPYARAPFGARTLRIEHGGAALDLDLDSGARSGDGL